MTVRTYEVVLSDLSENHFLRTLDKLSNLVQFLFARTVIKVHAARRERISAVRTRLSFLIV